jgi:CRP/FNR family transcriptional regulator
MLGSQEKEACGRKCQVEGARAMSIQKALNRRSLAKCEACASRHSGICAALPDEQLERLRSVARRRVVREGLPIFRAGDEVESYASVVSGVVKLIKTASGGENHVIALMYPSEFMGYSGEDEYRYSAAAAMEAELCIYPKAAFRRLLQEDSEFCLRVLEYTASELEFCRDWALMTVRKSAYERVAGFFLFLSRRIKNGGGVLRGQPAILVELPLTRTELADYLGLTLETVSRNVTRLRRQGLIELRSAREVIVMDFERLSAEAATQG